jgi:hypothetical protein
MLFEYHQRVEALEAENARLREALEPFAHFADQWNKQPLRGIADTVYVIHLDTEYEAAFRLSDCQIARRALGREESNGKAD